MKAIWTTAGDETSWPEWVEQMRAAPASDTARELISSLLPGSQHLALDTGCGTGRSFQPLVDRGYLLSAINSVTKHVLKTQLHC